MRLPDIDGPGGDDQPVYVEKYDLLGNLVQRVEPDPDGSGTTYVSPVTDYQYDRMDRVQKILGAEVDVGGTPTRPETRFGYNKADQTLKEVDPLNRETRRSYDPLGRLESMTLPDPAVVGGSNGAVTTYEWDAAGNLVEITEADPDGSGTQYSSSITTHVYDTRNRRISTTDPRGGVTRFSFDAAGNMLSLTDAEQNTTRWLLDNLNRPIAETNELGDTRSTFYDGVGNVVKIVDRNARAREFDHDPLHRMTDERWYDDTGALVRTITHVYNDADELTDASDPD
ncbi:MAG: RHS repeat protein, partial [Planctomycetes bacterium]|nr:RHS repeat protein [Planctomycetota bacterium]